MLFSIIWFFHLVVVAGESNLAVESCFVVQIGVVAWLNSTELLVDIPPLKMGANIVSHDLYPVLTTRGQEYIHVLSQTDKSQAQKQGKPVWSRVAPTLWQEDDFAYSLFKHISILSRL
jgi:hypothetical protein